MAKRKNNFTNVWREQPSNDENFDYTDAIFDLNLPDPPSQIPENALVPREDGTIEAGKFVFSKIGLRWDDSATAEEWGWIGEILFELNASIQLLLGDWLNQMEVRYGVTYQQIAQQTGYDKHTLYNYKYVMSRVEISLRKENLTFGHYNLVAGMSQENQTYWLERASEGDDGARWSVARLSQEIKKEIETPKLPSQNVSLFDDPPKVSKQMQKLYFLARNGDNKARQQILSMVTEHRKWLDKLEAGLGN